VFVSTVTFEDDNTIASADWMLLAVKTPFTVAPSPTDKKLFTTSSSPLTVTLLENLTIGASILISTSLVN